MDPDEGIHLSHSPPIFHDFLFDYYGDKVKVKRTVWAWEEGGYTTHVESLVLAAVYIYTAASTRDSTWLYYIASLLI